jgi:hypothetical protein
MNKLEHYLQQVCRSMGGPKALREHVRQELREHLLDAIAQHQNAGLSEQQAIDRALAEFGTPETVRGELEATHGHRMALAMVIDKAMEWKEKTMKAKWLWTTWTYLMVVGIIVLEILFCFFSMIYLLPKIKKLQHDGFLLTDDSNRSALTWMYDFLYGTADVFDKWFGWAVLGFLALWGLFEWRVKSENKPFMRLSVLNSVALGLLVVVVIMSVSMVLPFLLSMPALGKMTKPWVVQQLTSIDNNLIMAKMTAIKADRPELETHLKKISTTLKAMSEGPFFTTWMQWGDQATVETLEKSLADTQTQTRKALEGLWNKDNSILVPLVREVEKAFVPLREAAKKNGRKEE